MERRKKLSKWFNKESLTGYLFILPVVVHLLIFKYYTVIYSVRLSLYRGTLLNPFREYMGLKNYIFLFSSDYFIQGLVNILIYTTYTVPMGTVLALVLALLVDVKYWGKNFFRIVWYTPAVISMVATVQIWLWLYQREFGILNYLLNLVGLPSLGWIWDPKTALFSLVLLQWWLVGINMIIYLAALQNIPEEYYESATIDGCNLWQRFFHITLPILKPTTFFIILTSTIMCLMIFEPIYLMTGGGPMNRTTMTGYQIYEAAFEFNMWGRATAIAVVFFAIILIITFIQYRVLPDNYQ